jgi:hypothetical protein
MGIWMSSMSATDPVTGNLLEPTGRFRPGHDLLCPDTAADPGLANEVLPTAR